MVTYIPCGRSSKQILSDFFFLAETNVSVFWQDTPRAFSFPSLVLGGHRLGYSPVLSGVSGGWENHWLTWNILGIISDIMVLLVLLGFIGWYDGWFMMILYCCYTFVIIINPTRLWWDIWIDWLIKDDQSSNLSAPTSALNRHIILVLK